MTQQVKILTARDIKDTTQSAGATGCVYSTDYVNALGGGSPKSESTGAFTLSGGLAVASATTVALPSVTGQIVSVSGVVTPVSYTGTTVTDTFVSTTPNTYYTLGAAGVLQRGTYPTASQQRAEILLGYSIHQPLGTITACVSSPALAFNEMSQTRDIFGALGLVNRGIVPSAGGALTLNISSGTLYGTGIGYTTSPTAPSSKSIGPYTGASVSYRTSTGNAFTPSPDTSLDIAYYEVAGTRTALPGGKYSSSRIYVSPSGAVRLQYGQVYYSTMASAIAGLPTELYTPYPAFAQNFVLVGVLTASSSASDLTLPAQALFTGASIFGESLSSSAGTSTTTLQGAYDNAAEPEILTDSTHGALSIRRGSTADIDTVLDVQNGAGTSTSSISGAGVITGTYFRGTDGSSMELGNTPALGGQISISPTGSFVSIRKDLYLSDALYSEGKEMSLGTLRTTDDLASYDSVFYQGPLATSRTVPGIGIERTVNTKWDGSNDRALTTEGATALTLTTTGVQVRTAPSVAAGAVQTFATRLSVSATAVTAVPPIVTAAATATSESLILTPGVAPTTPTNGSIWTTGTVATGVQVRIAGVTKTLCDLNSAQTLTTKTLSAPAFSGTATGAYTHSGAYTSSATAGVKAVQYLTTVQSSALATGAITWNLGSGGLLHLTTALTGAITVTMSSFQVGTIADLLFTQGATAQTVSLAATGVTFRGIMTATTQASPVTLGSVSSAGFYYRVRVHFVTATLCYYSQL